MATYSTCADCGETLLITTPGDTVHPLCTPRPSKAEQLAHDWLDAIAAGDDQIAADLHTQIEELDNRPPRLLDAALIYASWGWPVFPLHAHSKEPATPHGFKDATLDPDRIKTWWRRHPHANIGLPTGVAFDVIDIDTPHGPTSHQQLLHTDTLPNIHGHAATASGGFHLYVEPTGGGNLAGMLPGVDYRGTGGYVVAPPSTLRGRGRAWSWVIKPSPAIRPAG